MRLLHHVLSSAMSAQQIGNHELAGQDHASSTPSPTSHEQQHSGSGTLVISHQSLPSRLNRIAQIVSEESGIPVAELSDETDLSSVGVDSLLALLITSRLKEDLDFDIGSGVSIFDKFRTLKLLKDGFIQASGLTSEVPSSSASSRDYTPDAASSSDNNSEPLGRPLRPSQPEKAATQARRVNSVVLHHAPASPGRASPRTLFLFPDGSGSPMSYASLAALATSSNMTLISLICPYRTDSQEMKHLSLDGLLVSYIGEIRRRQPRGPYSLGGWSSGGIFAYRASQILIDQGETVQNLVLIDSPALFGDSKDCRRGSTTTARV